MAANTQDNPDANCLPIGFLQLHTHTQPRKVIQTVDDMVIIYEANYGLRQIHTDGRSLPTNDPQPWWDGYSVGKWDGDTLVVETNGFRGDGLLDVSGSPFTEGLKLTERFRRVNFGRLEIDITIDDPKAYTKPWTVRVNQRLSPDYQSSSSSVMRTSSPRSTTFDDAPAQRPPARHVEAGALTGAKGAARSGAMAFRLRARRGPAPVP